MALVYNKLFIDSCIAYNRLLSPSELGYRVATGLLTLLAINIGFLALFCLAH